MRLYDVRARPGVDVGGIVPSGGEARIVQSEDLVVSPELVLVDPSLAARVRAAEWTQPGSPFSSAETVGDILRPTTPAAAAPEADSEQESRENAAARMPFHRRIRDVALTLSLALNAFVLANVYDDSTQSAPAPPSPVPRTSASFLQPSAITAGHAVDGTASVALPTNLYGASVEAAAASEIAQQRVLASLGGNPTLRQRYTNVPTGQPAPGVSAQCERPILTPSRPLVVRCSVWRLVAGERLATAVEYRPLADGGFRITVVG
jgi:hypothetical protein